MYVRSQNRKFLGEIRQVHIYGMNNNQIWSGDECLGVYIDEDRALEVIDMMQDRLEDGCTFYEISQEVKFKRESIFEMPLR